MSQPTISVETIENYNAIRMVWARHVNGPDVHSAFAQVQAILNASDQQMYVVVDILNQPQFPLGDTLQAAMYGPYRNPNLKEWLIVGTNQFAKMIERVLAATTGRHNVRWFDTEAEALDYLIQTTGMIS